jgi:transcriptional regulator with XRE-family HTH domain
VTDLGGADDDFDPSDPYDQELLEEHDPARDDVLRDAYYEERQRWLRLGEELRKAREMAGLSKRSAALKAGFSEGLWRHLEAGVKTIYGQEVMPNPRPENLVAAAQAVALSPEFVFEIIGRKPPTGTVVSDGGPALSSKLSRLTDSQREAIERLVDEMLGE